MDSKIAAAPVGATWDASATDREILDVIEALEDSPPVPAEPSAEDGRKGKGEAEEEGEGGKEEAHVLLSFV